MTIYHMEKVPRRMYVEQQKVRKKESGSSKIVLQNGKEYGMKKKTKGMNEVTRYMKIKLNSFISCLVRAGMMCMT